VNTLTLFLIVTFGSVTLLNMFLLGRFIVASRRGESASHWSRLFWIGFALTSLGTLALLAGGILIVIIGLIFLLAAICMLMAGPAVRDKEEIATLERAMRGSMENKQEYIPAENVSVWPPPPSNPDDRE